MVNKKKKCTLGARELLLYTDCMKIYHIHANERKHAGIPSPLPHEPAPMPSEHDCEFPTLKRDFSSVIEQGCW